MDAQFTTIGALAGLAVAIVLIIRKVQPAYSLILGALIGGLIGGSRSDGKLFDIAGIPIDEEKALIGMLIYILYKQGADIKLLLGLGYLLL